MFCPECGKEIADRSKFCPECGKAVKPIDYDSIDKAKKSTWEKAKELSEKSKPQPKKTDDDLSDYKAKYPNDFITPMIRGFKNLIALKLRDLLIILAILIVAGGVIFSMLYFSDGGIKDGYRTSAKSNEYISCLEDARESNEIQISTGVKSRSDFDQYGLTGTEMYVFSDYSLCAEWNKDDYYSWIAKTGSKYPILNRGYKPSAKP